MPILIVLTALIASYYFISVLPLQLAMKRAFKKIEEHEKELNSPSKYYTKTKPKGMNDMGVRQDLDDLDSYPNKTKPKGEIQMPQQAIIRSEVQVTPQIHQGAMAHYWRVFRIDAQGSNFTLHDGWHKNFLFASDEAYSAAKKYL